MIHSFCHIVVFLDPFIISSPVSLEAYIALHHLFLLKLAREYDLLIVEDDPYYFLQFQKVKRSFDCV